jgi:hypothetical protein
MASNGAHAWKERQPGTLLLLLLLLTIWLRLYAATPAHAHLQVSSITKSGLAASIGPSWVMRVKNEGDEGDEGDEGEK